MTTILRSNYYQAYGNEYEPPKGYEWLKGFIPGGCHVVVTNINLGEKDVHYCKTLQDVKGELIYKSAELMVFRNEYYFEDEIIPSYDIYIVWRD